MFTIEMDWDETAITILDESGEFEDFQVFMYDDIVDDDEDQEDVDERYDSIISSISFSCTKLLSVVPNLIL